MEKEFRMKIHFGFKIASLAAVLALAGCMTNQDTASEKARADAAEFVNTSAGSLAKELAHDSGSIASQFDAIGCPKLGKLFEDFSHYTGQGEFPQSFVDYLSCFGLSANPTAEEIDGMTEKFQNPTELLDCICGGSGLSELYNKDYLKWSAFDASTSAAASASFDGKTSAGDTFDGKGSAGSGFEGKGSIGDTFDGK
jgi:hypothetical protein